MKPRFEPSSEQFAEDVLQASDSEHLDEYLALAYFDIHGSDIDPFSRSMACAIKLHQMLLLEGCSVSTDAGYEGISSVQIKKDGNSICASADNLALAIAEAALAWHRIFR